MNLPGFPLPCPLKCGLPFGSDIVKSVAATAANSIMTAMSSWVVSGAAWLVQHVVGLISPATRVSLSAPWFEGRERAMIEIAALLVGPLVGAATIGAVIRQDGRRLARIFCVGLPVGILGTATAIATTQLALGLVDQLCALITPGHAYDPLLRLGRAIGAQQIPMFVQFIVASVVVLAAVALWLEMVLRATVLYIAVFFLPLGLAAFVWPATAHITKRFVELIAAVIGSKFVIVATLTLGGAVIGQDHVGVDAAVTGTAILLLAAFAPFSLLRLVPVVEAAAVAHLEGMARRPARAAVSAGTMAMSSGSRTAGVLGQLGGGAGAAAGSGVRPYHVATHVGTWPVPPAGSADAPAPGPGPAGGPGGGSSGGGFQGGGSSGGGSSGGGSSGGGPGGGGPGGGVTPAGDAAWGSGFAPAGDGPGSAAPSATGGEVRWSPVPVPPATIRPGSAGEDPDGWSSDV